MEDAKAFLKKYGVWIAGGVVVLYLVLKNASGGRSGANTAASRDALELAKLQQAGVTAAGAQGVDAARIQADLEARRLQYQLQQDTLNKSFSLQQQALNSANRNALLSAVANIAKSLTGLLTGSKSGQSGGGASGPGIGTPPWNPNAVRSLPSPVAPNLGMSIYNPTFTPSYPETPDYYPLDVTDWGQAPSVAGGSTSYDSGLTFNDQSYNDYIGGGFNYGGTSYGSPDVYSGFPELANPAPGQGEGIPAEEYYIDQYESSGTGGGMDYAEPTIDSTDMGGL